MRAFERIDDGWTTARWGQYTATMFPHFAQEAPLEALEADIYRGAGWAIADGDSEDYLPVENVLNAANLDSEPMRILASAAPPFGEWREIAL